MLLLCLINFRNHGFVNNGNPEHATFSCLHRYTKRPICAIRCNNLDDLCLNNEDELNCRQVNTIQIIVVTLLVVLLIGSALGEVIYRRNREVFV